jgi:hypothetical protein
LEAFMKRSNMVKQVVTLGLISVAFAATACKPEQIQKTGQHVIDQVWSKKSPRSKLGKTLGEAATKNLAEAENYINATMSLPLSYIKDGNLVYYPANYGLGTIDLSAKVSLGSGKVKPTLKINPNNEFYEVETWPGLTVIKTNFELSIPTNSDYSMTVRGDTNGGLSDEVVLENIHGTIQGGVAIEVIQKTNKLRRIQLLNGCKTDLTCTFQSKTPGGYLCYEYLNPEEDYDSVNFYPAPWGGFSFGVGIGGSKGLNEVKVFGAGETTYGVKRIVVLDTESVWKTKGGLKRAFARTLLEELASRMLDVYRDGKSL